MRFVRSLVLALAALALPAGAQSPTEFRPKIAVGPHREAPPLAQPTPAAGPATLTKPDVDAWLDGFVPYALANADVPGAVVVVVKNGQVLTERGFGFADRKNRLPVDPDRTLFRLGSISKLFTWTAVMQLVQAHKLDLDRDVNDYLDFRIPPAFGKPITLRNIMTHTAGFEETVKFLITANPKIVKPLDATLKRWVPTRIYAPGEVPAYSNYAATLAGYIVQRVSGEPFDAYVAHHILTPLAMAHSSFQQPLPPALAAMVAKGYAPGSDDPKPFEIIPLSPAGAGSATGADMAKFMIAHLQNGGPLLDPATAHMMYAPANAPIPGLPAMALGFYHEDRNGQTIIAHGGDTVHFHSDLHLYLDQGVGLFMAFNSPGKEGAVHIVRARLFDAFTDRYFPAATPNLPTVPSAKADGAAMVGHYLSTRGSMSNWLKIASLVSESTVRQNADGTISVSDILDPARNPKTWREVGPWQWQEVGGTERLNAVAKDGKVAAYLNSGIPQILVYRPAPASMNAGWILPAMGLAFLVVLITAVSWPVAALVRRNYGYRLPLTGGALQLHRATRATAWLLLAVGAGWLLIISSISSNLEAFNGGLDIWMRLLQLLTLIATVGTALACWNVYVAWRSPERRWWKYGWAALFALSALFLVWLAFTMKLVTFSLNY